MDMSPFGNVPQLWLPDRLWSTMRKMPIPTDSAVKSRKLAVWAAGNCDGTSYGRTAFSEALSKYMDIDFPGQCLHNLDGAPGRESWHHLYTGNSWSEQTSFYGQYLFVLSFHNTLDNANIDEKPYNPMLSNSVPVVIANDAFRFLSPGKDSFVDATSFDSPKALATYLLKLQANSTEYLARHFAWRTEEHAAEPPLLPIFQDVLGNAPYSPPTTKNSQMCRLCACLCDPNCMAKRASSECGYSQRFEHPPTQEADSAPSTHLHRRQTLEELARLKATLAPALLGAEATADPTPFPPGEGGTWTSFLDRLWRNLLG